MPKSCFPTTRFSIPVRQIGHMLIHDREDSESSLDKGSLTGCDMPGAACQVHEDLSLIDFRGR